MQQNAHLRRSPADFFTTEPPKRFEVTHEPVKLIYHPDPILLRKRPPFVKPFWRIAFIPPLVLCDCLHERLALLPQLDTVLVLGVVHEFRYRVFGDDALGRTKDAARSLGEDIELVANRGEVEVGAGVVARMKACVEKDEEDNNDEEVRFVTSEEDAEETSATERDHVWVAALDVGVDVRGGRGRVCGLVWPLVVEWH